uniref:Uncharacterized protein n=1 Tax=Anguilla anguilla TaxID=7936 RepID=A0A0E9T0Y9_ANGAN
MWCGSAPSVRWRRRTRRGSC